MFPCLGPFCGHIYFTSCFCIRHVRYSRLSSGSGLGLFCSGPFFPIWFGQTFAAFRPTLCHLVQSRITYCCPVVFSLVLVCILLSCFVQLSRVYLKESPMPPGLGMDRRAGHQDGVLRVPRHMSYDVGLADADSAVVIIVDCLCSCPCSCPCFCPGF